MKKKCNCNEEEKECTCKKEKCEEKNEECTNNVNETKILLENANNKIKELEEGLLRTKADNINYRKRLEDEQARILKYANEGLVKEILPIIDNFERAIKMDDENLDDELSKLLAGFKMVYCSLVEVLNSYEVKEIDVLNKVYDASNAQAVIQEPREGIEPGMVIEVLQKGYELKGKVIRPAMVKVSA